jgi:hypothetical protein
VVGIRFRDHLSIDVPTTVDPIRGQKATVFRSRDSPCYKSVDRFLHSQLSAYVEALHRS